MSSINKLGPVKGKLVMHRFSCPCCGTRLTVWRRLKSIGRRVQTYCPNSRRILKVWVPESIHEPQGGSDA